MPARTGKVTAKKAALLRQPSPEIPSPIKSIESNPIDNRNDDGIENQMPIDETETKSQPSSSVDSNETKIDLTPMTILLANGQPLLTNFEEKYLLDLILKTTNKDIEIVLQEKIHSILQMNYGSQSTSFILNAHWIMDFLLKHFQTLITHINSKELFEKILKKNFDKNNSTMAFKHWQLQTLVNEHSKKHPQTSLSQKRRMTVRHIDFH